MTSEFRGGSCPKAIEVGGHRSAVVDPKTFPILPVVAFTELDAGNLGNGMGLVGGLQRASEKGVFMHGLRGQFRVNTAVTQEN